MCSCITLQVYGAVNKSIFQSPLLTQFHAEAVGTLSPLHAPDFETYLIDLFIDSICQYDM